MSGHPRVLGPHVIRPSPLAQVSLSRPLSLVSDAPEYTRDPDFWKRFSIAVQANLNSMEADPSSASNNGSGTYSHKKKNPYVNLYTLNYLISNTIIGMNGYLNNIKRSNTVDGWLCVSPEL